MKLLAFETATEACSVALWIDGAVRERFEIAPRRHAELALPWAEALLSEAGIAKSQLDAIAVGRGPGAFTGVRLGVALAQGIALALDRPVVAISTLQVLAAGAEKGEKGPESFSTRNTFASEVSSGENDSGPFPPRRILAAIDARMGEVYSAAFADDGYGLIACSRETVSAPGAVELPGEHVDWVGVGTGFAATDGLLADRLQACLAHVDAAALPHAADLVRLAAAAFARGETLAPERVQPAYLRDNVALTLVQQQARKRI
jgi:tRNA threonylcarbamoyladenosine biosynthesis protein TsaB